MKQLFLILFITQEIFFSPLLNKYVLITSDPGLYDSVIFGTKEYVNQQKIVEFQAAMKRREPIAEIKAKCKQP